MASEPETTRVLLAQRRARTDAAKPLAREPLPHGRGSDRPLPPRERGDVRGMTLVEVLVASVILGIGVAGLMSAATLSMRNQLRGEHRATALYLAQQKLAEVDLIGAHVWLLARPMKGVEEADGVSYGWSLDIQQQQVGELFAVMVQVDWSGGSSGTIELETWLNDYAAKTGTGSGQQTPTRGNTGSTPPPR